MQRVRAQAAPLGQYNPNGPMILDVYTTKTQMAWSY